MITFAAMKPMWKLWRHLRRVERDFIRDRSALAAIEFAFILPLMLVVFFGTVAFSSGLASARKVTLTASALADLTSEMQAAGNIAPIADSDLLNNFNASISIMNPYLSDTLTPMTAQISEIYVDSNLKATYQWVRAAAAAPGATQASFAVATHNPGDPVTDLPNALLVKQTYLIRSDVGFTYVPTFGYGLMAQGGVYLSDKAYSRPRQATCLVYNGTQPTPVNGACPTP
jgi:Flp pilus assembly protein TadG